MQGIYVLSPGGRSLGRLNSNNPDHVLAMLERALQAWGDLSEADRRLADGVVAPEHRWELSIPRDGLILERYARDIGDDPLTPPTRPVNRDAVWFTREEICGLLPANFTVATTGKVPPIVASRLARFCLVDNVRGQTLPFAADEIDNASIDYSVRSIDGDRVELVFQGATRAVAKGPWLLGDNYWKPKQEWPRQLETRICGRATYDTRLQRFTEFKLVALGECHGRTAFNGRSRQATDATHKIGFLLQLAPQEWHVAPTFINVYDADWVAQPRPVRK